MLVAEGAADGAVDAIGLKVWDLAAVQVIVEEAGGRMTDIDGVARIDAGSADHVERADPRRTAGCRPRRVAQTAGSTRVAFRLLHHPRVEGETE